MNQLPATGDQLIRAFERAETPAASFHHADHVRLAFEYLSRYSALDALDKFSSALKRFAAAKGKANLYHETITFAFLFLIGERMARAGRSQTWDQFAACNADLLIFHGGILDRLYRKGTLASDLARATFILPDLHLLTCP